MSNVKGYVYVNKKNDTYIEIKEINFSIAEEDGKKNYYIDLCDNDSSVIFSLPIQRTMYFYLKQKVSRLNQALEYIIRNVLGKDLIIDIQRYEKENIQYYQGNLELSRRHILWEITTDLEEELYCGFVNEWLEKFKERYDCEVFLRGRSNRHCCIEDTDKNKLRYHELIKEFELFQDEFVEYINNLKV